MDFSLHVETPQILFQIIFRSSIACICGVIVGVERAYSAKPAGIRTHMLITLGSCLFMIVSLFVAMEAKKFGYLNADPGRIVAQVVSGIGFLGVGTIIRNKGYVRGMTSAATMWCMAAIGMAAGFGLIFTALIASILIVGILRLFIVLEKYFKIERQGSLFIDVIVRGEGVIPRVREVLRELRITLSEERLLRISREIHYEANLLFYGHKEKKIQELVKKIQGVKEIVTLSPHQHGDS